jgi:hypothetical protein
MKLFLPSTIKPSGLWRKRGKEFVDDVKRKTAWNAPAREPRIHPGKKAGMPYGVWVSDLAARHKVIILCWKCQSKFDHKKANYYKDRRFPHVFGKCDGCKDIMSSETKLYIHESFLGEPGGNTKAGQVWTPR